MAFTLVLADTEVARVELAPGTVRVCCAAAHVRRTEPGAATLVGWSRGVELLLAGATVVEGPAGCFGRLAHGRLRIDGQWASTLALPGACRGSVRLELGFANQSSLVVDAEGIDCRFEGDANFAESLFC